MRGKPQTSYTIALTKGKATIIDAEDAAVALGRKWVASWSGQTWYAVRGKGSSREYLHRTISGAADGSCVDHINGDTLDNRRSNLRVCTFQQNTFNSRKRPGSSRFKGVTWVRHCGKWAAQITHCGKRFYLGVYVREEDAAQAYDRESVRLFGAFAKTNFGGSNV